MAIDPNTAGTQRTRTRRFDAPRFSIADISADPPDDTPLLSNTAGSTPSPSDGPTDPPAGAASIRAYLKTLKWSESDIARILVGPQQAHLTAEGLYRQYAANSRSDQAALLDLLQKAGAQKVTVNPALLAGLNQRDLQPSTAADVADLVNQFSQLPDVQQMRFLTLLGSQKPPASKPRVTNPDVQFAPPAKSKSVPPATNTTDMVPIILKGSFDTLQTVLKGLIGGGGTSNAAGTNKKVAKANTGKSDEDTADPGSDSSGKKPAPKKTPSTDGKKDKDSSDSGGDDAKKTKADEGSTSSGNSDKKAGKDSEDTGSSDDDTDDPAESSVRDLIADDTAGSKSTDSGLDVFGPPADVAGYGDIYGPPSPEDFNNVSEPD